MTPLCGHDNTVAEFVSGLIPGCERGFGNCSAMGFVDKDGRLIAGVVYHNWNPEAEVIEISGASLSPKWLTRNVLLAMYGFAFSDIGVQMVVQRNSEKNIRITEILRRLGFDEYRIKRGRGRNEDELVFTLTDDRWAELKKDLQR